MLDALLVAVLPLALFGTIAVRIFSERIEQEIDNKNIEIAKALSGEIDRFLVQSYHLLQIANDLADLSKEDSALPAPAKLIQMMKRRVDVLERIELIDLQGKILHIAPLQQTDNELPDLDRSFCQEALTLNHPVFSETYLSRNGAPFIAVALPGKHSVAVGHLKLAWLRAITGKMIIGEGGYAVVVDRFGYPIAHPEERLVAKHVSLRDLEPIRRALAGETGTFRFVHQDTKMIGTTAIISRTGWIVMVCQPEMNAFAAVATMRKMLLLGMVVIGLLAMAFAFVMAKKPLNSLFRLVGVTRQVARGDYRIADVPATYPEIDSLANAFQMMAGEIATREDALTQTKERYRDLVEGSFDGIFIQKGTKIIFTNRRLCEMLGYNENELIGLDHWLIYHPDYQEVTKNRALARLRGEDAPLRYEVKLLRRDGSSFYGEISARAVKVEEEAGIQVWVRDISEQKGAEEQRALFERRFLELYNSVSDLIYTQDLQGRFLSANKAMSDLFGYTHDEFIGLKASDFMDPKWAALFEQDYLEKIKKQNGEISGVTSYFAKDGRKFYLEWRSVLVKPADGEPFISGIGRDVTERILSERALREKEQNISAILYATPSPLAAYDSRGDVLFINPAFTEVFGWTLEELKGKKPPFLPQDQQEKIERLIRELYSRREIKPMTMETTGLTKDGRLLNIFLSASLIVGRQGSPTGIVVSLADITQRKKLEEHLQQTQKLEAVGELAAGIAHDFNNLLMGIQGNVSLLLLDIKPGNPFYERLEHVEEFIRQGADLTGRLLGFARAGKYEVKIYNLNEIVADVLKLFGATKKEIRITQNLNEAPCPVEVDRIQIQQVLMNLFVNASQAMPAGGDLTVSTETVFLSDDVVGGRGVKAGRYVKVSVQDTGIGMDEETRKRIFDPFFTTKRAQKSSGLGLASVYGIVKNHGGFIDVYSEKGKGSVFIFYLPAAGPGNVAEFETSEKNERLIPGQGTILLVDDERTIVDVGREMLEILGYDVITAQSGQEAIEKFSRAKTQNGEAKKIDLVILDMIMPSMSGEAVFAELKKADPEVNVLLSSGYSASGRAAELLSMGCRGFIQKPFTMEQLSKKVSEVMRKVP